MNELQLFRQGHDTAEIAWAFCRSEAQVYNAMHAQRNAERHDFSQQEHADRRLSAKEYQREYAKRYYVKTKAKRDLQPYAGSER